MTVDEKLHELDGQTNAEYTLYTAVKINNRPTVFTTLIVELTEHVKASMLTSL